MKHGTRSATLAPATGTPADDIEGRGPVLPHSLPHEWNVTPAAAREIQAELAGRVSLVTALLPEEIAVIAGIDNAYLKEGRQTFACAAVVALTFPDLEPMATTVAWQPVTFPYVPGLLSFREGPAVLAALAKLAASPDLFFFDGQGYAHPRRLGLASHLGMLLDRPAIGCAKSRLIGTYEEPAQIVGAWTPLLDRDEVIGAAVRTRPRHKPLFVSPGHKLSVATAVALTLACCHDSRFLPEPTRLAHELVTRERNARAEKAKTDGAAAKAVQE